jgi:hypothetical protein
MRRHRILRWWPVALAAVVAIVLYLAWPGRSTFTIGPDSTRVTEPLDGAGRIDYAAALDDRIGEGVTPETNANVPFVAALGPRPAGGVMPDEFYRRLGIARPPEEGEYFTPWTDFVKTRPAAPKGIEDRERPAVDGVDRLNEAKTWPWRTSDFPDVADWLKRNERPLAVIAQAMLRPHYFNPLVPKSPDGQSARLLNSALSTAQAARDVAAALACRAMWHAGEGRYDRAWEDLLACQRLGRQVGRGAMLIECLVGSAIIAVATNAQVVLIGVASPTSETARRWLDDLQRLPAIPAFAPKIDLGERFTMLEGMQRLARSGPSVLEKLDDTRPQDDSPPAFASRLFTRSTDWDPALRHGNQTYDRIVAAAGLPRRGERQEALAELVRELKQRRADLAKPGTVSWLVQSPEDRGEIFGNVLIGLVVPALLKIQDAVDRVAQGHESLRIALALAAYRADVGRYPARLEDVAPKYLPAIPDDLFSGKPLKYRLSDDGYLLYSVGKNGVDDDGRSSTDEPAGDDLAVRMPPKEPVRK